MKRLLLAILSLAMVLSVSTTAFAKNIDQDSDSKTSDADLTYEVVPAYTVTIPENIKIGETATVSAQNVVISKDEHLEIALMVSDFKVRTDNGAELAYTVSMDGKQLELGDAVLSVESGDNNSGSSTLSFALDSGETVKYAGKYKGSVTFTISVEEGGAEAAFYERIRTADQLRSFRDRVNSGETSLNAILINDIDLDNGWDSIGNFYIHYNGTFDGRGHIISGISISGGDRKGLFGWIGENGMVKKLGVDGSIIADVHVGGIAGINEGTIENCFNSAVVKGSIGEIGGIVGANYGRIVNCYNTGAVSSEGGYIGGVVGFNYDGTVTNCYYLDTCGAGGLGTSLTKEQFKSQANFIGWNFDTIWQMNSTLGRPTLR